MFDLKDFMGDMGNGYKSPIEIIQGEWQMQMEGDVLRAVQNYGINVNKEELEKALAYDRHQYNQGYYDGLNADKWIPCSERLPSERDWYLAVFKEPDTDFVLVPRVADYIGKTTKGTTNEGWYIIDWGDKPTDYYKELKCIAWQPLPEPYKPQREEE